MTRAMPVVLSAEQEAILRDDPAACAWIAPELTIRDLLATLDAARSTGHDLVPFPTVGKFAEVRMVYCRRCGATQPVEAGDRPPLPPCNAGSVSA